MFLFIHSDLSALFDAIQSLLFPMSWLHTFVPALPVSHRHYIDAPTPYLIGLLAASDQVIMSSQQSKEETFWRQIVDGSYPLDSDCLVVQIEEGRGKILRRPPADFSFPPPVVELLHQRLSYFDFIFNNVESRLDREEAARGKFIILCETFLQMYKTVFGDLVRYINCETSWRILPQAADIRERYFDVSSMTKKPNLFSTTIKG